jgi:type VI protein secretion system component VasF
MGGNRELERLCNPLFLTLCQYWQLACIDSPVELEPFREKILAHLQHIKEQAGLDEELAREFALIEKPLIFFIDYMVREGKFSFRDKWQILARGYNELSGDEKFFDLLEETLKNPEAKTAASLFFVMLGLGFDGMYRRQQGHVQDCLSRCAEKTGPDFDAFSTPLIPELKKRTRIFSRRRWFGVRVALIASACFMALCFAVNMAVFTHNTAEYRELLSKTVVDAVPSSEVIFTAPPEGPSGDPASAGTGVLEGDSGETVEARGSDYDLVYPEADPSLNPGGEDTPNPAGADAPNPPLEDLPDSAEEDSANSAEDPSLNPGEGT